MKNRVLFVGIYLGKEGMGFLGVAGLSVCGTYLCAEQYIDYMVGRMGFREGLADMPMSMICSPLSMKDCVVGVLL